MTYREARTWLKRSEVTVGVLPECEFAVMWLGETERLRLAAHLRHSEGMDCNVAGDAVLYRLPTATYLVVEQ